MLLRLAVKGVASHRTVRGLSERLSCFALATIYAYGALASAQMSHLTESAAARPTRHQAHEPVGANRETMVTRLF
jgi:hypothetical protein